MNVFLVSLKAPINRLSNIVLFVINMIQLERDLKTVCVPDTPQLVIPFLFCAPSLNLSSPRFQQRHLMRNGKTPCLSHLPIINSEDLLSIN